LVTQNIQRSGQPGLIRLQLHYWLFPFKSAINLAWEPEKSKDQVYEKEFCERRSINYYSFSWNAGGPKDWREVDRVIEMIERCEKPVWIHCKGGKDRTGGLVALWKKKKGYPMGLIFRDFKTHGIPAFPWVQKLLREDIGLLPLPQSKRVEWVISSWLGPLAVLPLYHLEESRKGKSMKRDRTFSK
jgi:hypothetical protein